MALHTRYIVVKYSENCGGGGGEFELRKSRFRFYFNLVKWFSIRG